MRKQYHTRWVGGDRHTWDVHRLVRLASTLDPKSVPLSQISELDELWWYQEKDERPTPRSIAEHIALVRQTDLKYPVILCSEGRLMDGMHRAVKALVEDRVTIKAVQFSQTPEPDYINVDPDELEYPDEDVSHLPSS